MSPPSRRGRHGVCPERVRRRAGGGSQASPLLYKVAGARAEEGASLAEVGGGHPRCGFRAALHGCDPLALRAAAAGNPPRPYGGEMRSAWGSTVTRRAKGALEPEERITEQLLAHVIKDLPYQSWRRGGSLVNGSGRPQGGGRRSLPIGPGDPCLLRVRGAADLGGRLRTSLEMAGRPCRCCASTTSWPSSWTLLACRPSSISRGANVRVRTAEVEIASAGLAGSWRSRPMPSPPRRPS